MAFQIFQYVKEFLQIVFWMMRPGFPRMKPEHYRACKDGQRDVLLRMSLSELMKVTAERDMPLHVCAKANRLECVQSLLQIYGQSFILHRMLMLHYYPNSCGNTALHEAAKAGHATVVEELVRRYQRLASRVNKYGETPLFLSCEKGHFSCVQSLLGYDNGSSALTTTENGRLSLHVAAFKGYEEIVDCIANSIKGKKVIRMKDRRGATALHWAAEGKQVAVAKYLIETKPNLCYAKDNFGRCPIHIAAMKGDIELIDCIVSARPDCIDMRSSHEKTILHYAVENGCVSLIEWICNDQTYHEFQGNERDNMGNEPLHVAVMSCSNDTIFETLLRVFPCANSSNMNRNGLTPMELCHKGEVSESIKEILKTTYTYENNVRVTTSKSKSNESKGVIEISSVIAALIATTAATMQYSTDETVHDRESKVYFYYDFYISWAFFASMFVLLVWLVLDPLTKQGMPHRPWLIITMPILGLAEVFLSAAFFVKMCLGPSRVPRLIPDNFTLMASAALVMICVLLWILYGIWRSCAEMPRKETFKTSVFFLLVRLPIIMLLGIVFPFILRGVSPLQAMIFISIPFSMHRFGHIRAFIIVVAATIVVSYRAHAIAGSMFETIGVFTIFYLLS